MQVIHEPVNKTEGSVTFYATGVMFSVNHYDRTGLTRELVDSIDEFFDNLEWSNPNPSHIVPKVNIGDFLMFLDLKHKWMYKGSRTVPPCTHGTLWTVISQILPIKKKHYDQLEVYLKKAGIDKTGSARATQPINNQDPIYVVDIKKANTNEPDSVDFNLHDDGSIDVSFSNKDGPIAFIYPELKGKTSINYKVRMDRKITVKNDPVCDKV